mmetsp:Transcript_14461/g.43440  ORF Transcript_14461/g.43440 Transcript_14461/m.43440 type:complete len:239 (+) Transcript_14461:541-1257(+)
MISRTFSRTLSVSTTPLRLSLLEKSRAAIAVWMALGSVPAAIPGESFAFGFSRAMGVKPESRSASARRFSVCLAGRSPSTTCAFSRCASSSATLNSSPELKPRLSRPLYISLSALPTTAAPMATERSPRDSFFLRSSASPTSCESRSLSFCPGRCDGRSPPLRASGPALAASPPATGAFAAPSGLCAMRTREASSSSMMVSGPTARMTSRTSPALTSLMCAVPMRNSSVPPAASRVTA